MAPPPLRDPARGRRNRDALALHLGPAAAAVLPRIDAILPTVPDPDMGLNNLERLFARQPARDRLPELLADDARGLADLLQLLATSQHFADTLVTDPDALAVVLAPPGRNPSTAELTQQLKHEVDAAGDDAKVLAAFRRFRHQQTLRIGTGDVIRDRTLEEVTRELSRAADAAIEVAVQTAIRTLSKRFGTPTTPAGKPARLTALAFGKLGGDELNYSSDIDLMFVFDDHGETTGKRSGAVPNAEFFARVVTEVIRLLSSVTDRGFAYRIDLRLRPEGARGPLARSVADTLSYYDVMGRTWERQALIKLRHCGGDGDLGREFVRAIEPFVYRKYFSFSEINEVKALKRRMEQRAARGGADDADVKTGRGGIRDIEYTVQFLQLLNGGDLPAVRQRNTLLALDALEIAGCLTAQETYLLADGYRFLRKTEHRLQLLFDLQTHKLPTTADGLRTLALRMGYAGRTVESNPSPQPPPPKGEGEQEGTGLAFSPPPTLGEGAGGRGSSLAPQKRSPLDEAPPPPTLDTRDLLVDPLDQFLKDLHDTTRLHRAVLDHLLHQTFAAGEAADPAADLILEPDPDPAAVAAVLGRYPFRDVPKAYQNLTQLARESVPFLSHRRCRHFLASIAPQLLAAVAETPDPDAALNDLERVTASLGAKAVLYELFSHNPPALKLYVDLCAGSPFLSGLLINNPGMIDELLDSLVLDRPRTADELSAELTELCRGASDLDPILHSFQDKELLRIGVRDLLGKETVRETTAALSDLADAVLTAAFALAEPSVRRKYGTPVVAAAGGRMPVPCRFAILALGKLGGRELSYHGDLDLLVVYEVDGNTVPSAAAADPYKPTTHQHYFAELAQKAIQTLTRTGPMGRLYAVDMRLRPTGKSGSLVLPLDEFGRYFAGGCQLWERQALCRARVVRGEPGFAATVEAAVREAILGAGPCPTLPADVRLMRDKLAAAAGKRSLKRAPGGLADVEFAVQLLQLTHGRDHPTILTPNLWAALDAIESAGLLPVEQVNELRSGYTFLRTVETRLRVVADRPLTDVPDAAAEWDTLARRLGFATGSAFAAELTAVMSRLRDVYRQIVTG